MTTRDFIPALTDALIKARLNKTGFPLEILAVVDDRIAPVATVDLHTFTDHNDLTPRNADNGPDFAADTFAYAGQTVLIIR